MAKSKLDEALNSFEELAELVRQAMLQAGGGAVSVKNFTVNIEENGVQICLSISDLVINAKVKTAADNRGKK
jgi:hypothetical protein